jgi:uncharacterized protein (TIGR03435 family)
MLQRCLRFSTGSLRIALSVATISLCFFHQSPSSQNSIAPATLPITSNDAAAAHSPAFDAVSIKPSKPGTPLGGGGELTRNEYRAVGWPLGETIGIAYLPRMWIFKNVFKDAPGWVWSYPYDFVAKVAPGDLAQWQKESEHWGPAVQNKMLQAMLQTVLSERCKLKVHFVTADSAGFALVVGTRGPNRDKLKVSKSDETVPPDAVDTPEGGRLVPYARGSDPVMTYFHTSMSSLAANLSQLSRIPVEDKTGLSGKYSFVLARWSDSDDLLSWDLKALGLKLVRIKVPKQVLVIDHIERPLPN